LEQSPEYSRDNTGLYSKFNPPTVVNGKIYLGTFSEQLDVYGLLSLPLPGGETLFTTQTPSLPNLANSTAYEQGVRFKTSVAGQVTAIRYWKAASETGTHTGHIWSGAGKLLASVTFTNETPSGWQQEVLTTPLSLTAQRSYVVSVNTNTYGAVTHNALNFPVANGEIGTIADGKNGVYGPPGAFPTNSYENSNYFRDVVFVPSGGQSVFTNQSPALTGQNDSTSYELGLKFTSDQPGAVTAIRYWKDASVQRGKFLAGNDPHEHT